MGRPQPLVDGTAVVSEEKQEMRIWTRKRRPGEDRPVRPPVGFPPGRTLGSPVYPPSGGISGSHGVTNYGPIAMPHGPTPPQARNDRRNHLTRGRDTPGGNREAGLPAPVPWSGTTKRNEDAGRGTQSCDQALLPWIQVLRTPYCVVGYCRVRPRPSILAVRCAPNSRPSLVNRLVSWGGRGRPGPGSGILAPKPTLASQQPTPSRASARLCPSPFAKPLPTLRHPRPRSHWCRQPIPGWAGRPETAPPDAGLRSHRTVMTAESILAPPPILLPFSLEANPPQESVNPCKPHALSHLQPVASLSASGLASTRRDRNGGRRGWANLLPW